MWESESSGNTEWVLEDSFEIEEAVNDSVSTQHACVRWFSCENGLFVLVVGIGSLIHLYSLIETPSDKQGLKQESVSHRYKKLREFETRSCTTPSELGMCYDQPWRMIVLRCEFLSLIGAFHLPSQVSRSEPTV